ncbi:uncharacterized protein MELLADRAFT_101678 [Melampsora larici-populina 98AG31]|uniref:Uncharacterized protein n=1 Tax=Melampsora larici-populina (strain 98AG31 / pathotype 3-4-7) TaxID=747676 RepID=F4R6M1_MELLP|nr:uncharacterized protein MELLADRAFT_101678 [Melampsora larici-populina 98AG31]EGG11902.1 hypothetical protein MELLADRAFT_101678 [Melampsora larici-populina 98AG31]
MVAPKYWKDKGKEIPEDDEDWTPADEVSSAESEVDDRVIRNLGGTKNSKNHFPNTHQSGSNTTNPNIKNPTTNPNTPPADPLFEEDFNRNKGVQDPDLASTVAEQTRTIAHLHVKLTKTDAKVEALESEVRTLTGIVDKLIGKSKESEESGSKSGGRTAACVQFHVACMLGPGAHKKLPNPASLEEKAIDKYKSRVVESIPGTSPGQKGRRPRQRIRGNHRPLSRIEAPVGLPVDCYSDEWLGTLSAVQRAQLEIHPAPVLGQFSSMLATDD